MAKKYDSFTLSDHAHSLGVINKKYQDYDLHLKIGTFSKACAGYGGYVSANQEIINYLRNFSKSAIYSTALPPATLAGNLKALEIIEKKDLTKKLWENINYFCSLIDIENQQSAIIPIIIGDNAKTLKIAENLKDQGFLVSAIRPPTVAIGKSRLRITIGTSHTRGELKSLATNLRNLT
ncbi:MAG: 8-amino-7-oxononanoate synthase [Rickettsiales bacterium]